MTTKNVRSKGRRGQAEKKRGKQKRESGYERAELFHGVQQNLL